MTQSSDIITRMENLTAFTDYTCTLELINVAGKSEKSSEVTFQTKEDGKIQFYVSFIGHASFFQKPSSV